MSGRPDHNMVSLDLKQGAIAMVMPHNTPLPTYPTRSFNLASVLEDKAQTAIRKSFDNKLDDLADKLAIAFSKSQSLQIPMAPTSEMGDIGKTNAFARFRKEMLEVFPDVNDVTFWDFKGQGITVFSLKSPSP